MTDEMLPRLELTRQEQLLLELLHSRRGMYVSKFEMSLICIGMFELRQDQHAIDDALASLQTKLDQVSMFRVIADPAGSGAMLLEAAAKQRP